MLSANDVSTPFDYENLAQPLPIPCGDEEEELSDQDLVPTSSLTSSSKSNVEYTPMSLFDKNRKFEKVVQPPFSTPPLTQPATKKLREDQQITPDKTDTESPDQGSLRFMLLIMSHLFLASQVQGLLTRNFPIAIKSKVPRDIVLAHNDCKSIILHQANP
jgi:hypothetical protein